MDIKTATPSQVKAITTLDKNLLVAAAAGSGKTSVLTERILGIITNKDHPTAVDKLLVLTFANAAAAEIRVRLRETLSKQLRQTPSDDNLRLQASLLGRAHISTIHTFAIYVVRRYFYLTDADPHFKIADTNEMELLKREVVEKLLEDEYAAADNHAFLSFVESYGGTKASDSPVAEHILALHRFIMNIPFYEFWLEEAVGLYSHIDVDSQGETPWHLAIRNTLRQNLQSARKAVDQALKIANLPDAPDHYIPALEADGALIDNLLHAAELPFAQAYAIFTGYEFTKLPAKKFSGDIKLKELITNIRKKNIKGRVDSAIKGAFPKSLEAIAADLAALAPHIAALCRLTLKFTHRFNAEKLAQNLLDFNDLEHLCLKIFVDPLTMMPTDAAGELRAHFEHVMIDEYQDSNPVQEMILQAIARDSNRFMVGDIKQSIYRFRSADPSIFNEKYNTYDTDESAENNFRIDLQHNFRSRSEILETVNLVFRQIMSKQSCGIDYDDKAALTPPKSAELSHGENPYKCEVLIGIRNSETVNYENDEANESETDGNEVSQEDFSSAILEAEIVAARITELVGTNPLQIYDKDCKCHRNATYADITILLRKAKDASAFSEVFARKNIPLDTGSFGGTGATSLFDTIEVATLISFLEIIDNPRQDIPLVAVLSSPIYNFSPDELLEVRAVESRVDFYDCILSYINETTHDPFIKSPELVEKLLSFLAELNNLRDSALSKPASILIADIFECTDYANIVSAMPMGNMRQANLRLFRERAEAFESSRKQGLFHFMRYITDLREKEQKFPSAQMADGNTSVRLMSVHKSKGLEFPIVFFCRTSGEFNNDDLKRDLLFDKELFIGAKLIDPIRRIRSNTISHSAILNKIRDESTAEEMRILYVALTRARDKLIITGCVPNEKALLKHELQGLSENVYIDPAAVLASNTMLDWLIMSLSRHKQGGVFRTDSIPPANFYLYSYPADFGVKTFTAQDIIQIEDAQDIAVDTNQCILRADTRSAPTASGDVSSSAEIEQMLSWNYSFSHTHTPSKLSISEIKRLYQAQMQDSYATVYSAETYPYRKPNFLEQKKGFSPAETGTIIHTVMEHLDLHSTHEEGHVHAMLEQLVAQNILTAEEAKAVPVKLITGFVKSPLAMRMRAASELRKEVPFVLALNASEIYRDIDFHEHARPILVHGIIDAYFVENGMAVIVDYKSDFVAPTDTPEQIQAKYSVQLEIYRKAVERTANLPVKECILYMLRANSEVFVI